MKFKSLFDFRLTTLNHFMSLKASRFLVNKIHFYSSMLETLCLRLDPPPATPLKPRVAYEVAEGMGRAKLTCLLYRPYKYMYVK